MNLMRNELDFSSEPALTPNTDPYALAKALSGRHLIGGKLVPASSGNSFEVIDPAPKATRPTSILRSRMPQRRRRNGARCGPGTGAR